MAGSSLPNLSYYSVNPTSMLSLEDRLMCYCEKVLLESLSPSVVPTLLMPKKDGSWRMRLACLCEL